MGCLSGLHGEGGWLEGVVPVPAEGRSHCVPFFVLPPPPPHLLFLPVLTLDSVSTALWLHPGLSWCLPVDLVVSLSLSLCVHVFSAVFPSASPCIPVPPGLSLGPYVHPPFPHVSLLPSSSSSRRRAPPASPRPATRWRCVLLARPLAARPQPASARSRSSRRSARCNPRNSAWCSPTCSGAR